MSDGPGLAGGAVGRRVWMCGIGALAGFAAWLLIDVLPDLVTSERVLLFLAAATGGVFTALLAAAGALPPGRALIAATVAAVPAAMLLLWASFRYIDVSRFVDSAHAAFAFVLIVALSLPFVIVALRPGGTWRDYPALFQQAWDITVRFAAALVFVGVFWAVLFLSDALLRLVGLNLIEDLIDLDPVPPVLTGAVAGLALAVVAELADYISPFLILRLLRLFLPAVLVVAAIFLVALPFRGLSNLFGGLSAAAVLLAMAVGIATLITSAVERDDDEAVQSPVMRGSAQLLALTVPILSALALYSVLIRVGDYGWSPDRIAAACAAAVGLGYGLLYAVAVVGRRDWTLWIRQANTAMALAVIGVSALWLSPVLNAERLSAKDQLARFAAGRHTAEELDLWFLGRELGHAGKRALAELEALNDPELDERLLQLETASSRYVFEQGARADEAAALREEIAALAASVPAGRSLAPDLWAAARPDQLTRWTQACRTLTPAGNPGCAVVFADLLPERSGDEVLFLFNAGAKVFPLELGETTIRTPRFFRSSNGGLTPADLDRIMVDAPQVRALPLNSVNLGGTELFVLP